MGTLNSLRTTVSAQFQQIVQRGLRTWQDNNVSPLDVSNIIGIEEVDTRVAFQRVEVGKIRDMPQQHHSHVHLALSNFALFLFETHGVLFLDVDVFKIRYDAQDWYTTNVLHHLPPFVEEAHVATELIDDDTLDEFSVLWCLQGYTAIDRSKHATTVYIADQNHVSLRMTSHRHIYQVTIPQIDFCNAASPFHHNGMILCCQAVERCTDFCTKVKPLPQPLPK